jgi:hypothetical protein
MAAIFQHANCSLVDNDRVVRNAGAPPLKSAAEYEEIVNEIGRYIESKLTQNMGFVSITIPDDDSTETEHTSVLASADWVSASKLLMIIQNAPGSMLGIFSRSICTDEALSKGSMLPYVERAVAAGYAVLILRPNTNSTFVVDETTKKVISKKPILGSESPELHAMYVLENLVPQCESLTHLALLSYGNGASLCKELLLRNMVKSKADGQPDGSKIKAFVSIEASHIVEEDDTIDFKTTVEKMAINMECNQAPRGYRLGYRKKKLGVTSLSLGLPPGQTEVQNVAASISLALDPVFEYLRLAETDRTPSRSFAIAMATAHGHNPQTAEVTVNPNAADELVMSPPPPAKGPSSPTPPPATTPKQSGGFLSSILGGGSGGAKGGSTSKANGSKAVDDAPPNTKLSLADFDLLKVVGKGAFGKVMLVRKKEGVGAGQIYAMKVLKKSVVASLGQIEHTKSEREILFVIRHPYIVRLRFSFQNDEKLFLVTDYYNGGSLYSHLKKVKFFSEDRAKFYGAELLSALDHLHQQHIIYRDLKLENILMDHVGHIALTDFGLSKQDIDKTGGATTFCGTAEYIAPELLNNQKYGKAVDWWSFGILLFEMMNGSTPFYDKNRKVILSFECVCLISR